MSTSARKARKRAGTPFVRTPKVGTPLEDRSVGAAFDRNGRSRGALVQHASNRGVTRLTKTIEFLNSFKPAPKARAKKAAA